MANNSKHIKKNKDKELRELRKKNPNLSNGKLKKLLSKKN